MHAAEAITKAALALALALLALVLLPLALSLSLSLALSRIVTLSEGQGYQVACTHGQCSSIC